MTILPRTFGSSARRLGSLYLAALAFLVSSAVAHAGGGLNGSSLLPRIAKLQGSATNTITQLTPINETTFEIKAQQVGRLTTFGNFTGEFSYTATGTPQSIVLIGDATLTNDRGEQLDLIAVVVEVGADYPLTVTGTLIVTGGTGRFARAVGTIGVTGQDGESPVDTFHLNGALLMSAFR